MSMQQLGLLMVTPALVGMAIALCRQGAMSRGAAVLASLASIAAAAWMFFGQ